MSESVKVRVENGIGHIVLNRPQKLNSLSVDLIESLTKALQAMEKDENVKLIVLSGDGKAFCAGGDLDTVRSFKNPSDIYHYMHLATNISRVILNLNKFVISAVHGSAAGAGFSIALASDFIVAEPTANFRLSFANIGVIPDLGLMKLLSERVSLALVKEWVVSGAVITAEEAKAFGIINRLAEGDLLQETLDFAQVILNGAPLSHKFVKHMLNHGKNLDWDSVLQHEIMVQTFLMQTKDMNEGIQAYFEKRPPAFTGK